MRSLRGGFTLAKKVVEEIAGGTGSSGRPKQDLGGRVQWDRRAAMKIHRLATIAAMVGLSLAGGAGLCSRQAREAKPAPAAGQEEERVRLLAEGKGIFVEKCAKCHNERGDKELSSGKPLSERGLSQDAIARIVSGRLSKGSDVERRAVTLYITTLMRDPAKGESKP